MCVFSCSKLLYVGNDDLFEEIISHQQQYVTQGNSEEQCNLLQKKVERKNAFMKRKRIDWKNLAADIQQQFGKRIAQQSFSIHILHCCVTILFQQGQDLKGNCSMEI